MGQALHFAGKLSPGMYAYSARTNICGDGVYQRLESVMRKRTESGGDGPKQISIAGAICSTTRAELNQWVLW